MGKLLIKPKIPSQIALKRGFKNLYLHIEKLRKPLHKKSEFQQVIFNYNSLYTNKQIKPLIKLFEKLKLHSYTENMLLPGAIESKEYWILLGNEKKIMALVGIFQYFEACLDMYIQYRYKLNTKQRTKGYRNNEHFKSIESKIKKQALMEFTEYIKLLLDGKYKHSNRRP